MTLPTENDNTVSSATHRTVKKISCHSRVLSEKFSYTWKMKDFNRIPFIAKHPIFSPTFALGKQSDDSLWQVRMTKHMHCPNKKKTEDADNSEGEGDEESDSKQKLSEFDSTKSSEQQSKIKCLRKTEKIKRLGLRLIKIEEKTPAWEALKYYFTLKTSNGIKYSTNIREEASPPESEYIYITEKNLKGTDFFQESTVTLTCHITFKYLKSRIKESLNECEGKICADDLILLYKSQKFSDVILVAEGAEFPAHKSILFARAGSFEGILQDYKEATKEKIDMKVSEVVGHALVSFMYCGDIKEGFPVNKCLELYEAAKTYGVSNLKKQCSKYFKSHLDPEVCRKCLKIDEHLEDCLAVVRKISSTRLIRILCKMDTCSHNAMEEDQ